MYYSRIYCCYYFKALRYGLARCVPATVRTIESVMNANFDRFTFQAQECVLSETVFFFAYLSTSSCEEQISE